MPTVVDRRTPGFHSGAECAGRTGSIFRPGGTFLGQDLAATLDSACPNAAVQAPQAETGPAPVTTAPGVSLARLADANGNIDVHA